MAFVVYICFVLIETSAPTRIELAGGTIDRWPLYLFHPASLTLNAAISSASLGHYWVASGWRVVRDRLVPTPVARLVECSHTRGTPLTTSSQSPAGAGIAGSSALNVPVCAALADWNRRHYDAEALLQ